MLLYPANDHIVRKELYGLQRVLQWSEELS